jgi:release factor glutamine methyltransferase
MNKVPQKHPVTNTISDVWNWFYQSLCLTFPEQEARFMSRDIFEQFFDLPPDQRVLKQQERLPESAIQRLERAIISLKDKVPLQYVTGSCCFLGIKLRVTPAVLIPRPETEELAQWVISKMAEYRNTETPAPKILDMGTGSGCIAIAVAKVHPNIQVYACDVSKPSLEVARYNALNNNVNITLFECDMLHPLELPDKLFGLDIMVSNPPYVRESERDKMQSNVLDHEPARALFVPDHDPLLYYRAIALLGQKVLNPGGLLFLEINEAFGSECCQMLEEKGYQDMELRKDFNGRDRFISAALP